MVLAPSTFRMVESTDYDMEVLSQLTKWAYGKLKGLMREASVA